MSLPALLFTDLVDSTQLVERLGDAAAAALWAEHDRRARGLLAAHRGLEIDRTDGFFLLFDDPANASRYALAYHQALVDLALSARVGLHVGAVTLRQNDPADVARGAKRIEVEGLAKPLAARIMALARGGQTLLSAAARTALAGDIPEGAEIESHGHYRLKGVDEPVEVFELGGRASAAFEPPRDTDKAYRVVQAGELWRPVRDVRHNLPAERDAFVGRSSELRTLARKLDAGARLTTVLGPGGTGKTRFVRRYGHAWVGDWPGGVFFCDLSEARSLDGVLGAVAVALSVPLGKDDAAVQLGHAIAGRGRCLVILDNFEQVLAHAPATLGRWLDRAANAAFVVTSRERLHLPGEELFPIEPLPLGTEAIDLFAARARAQRPDFVLGDANRAAVAEVVQLLDGLPLAIELAAARIRVFSPGQLVERMKDRFRLLAGARGAAARQATLKSAIDWSWDLLAPWEQAALAQCSVFEGGFTLGAAEAVLELARWPEAPPVMDAVQALVDKSLLRTRDATEQGRYDIDEPYFGMYLSIHEYAAEKLAASGQDAKQAIEKRHGLHFSTFGTAEAIEALSLHGGVRRRRALGLELDNLVSACRRAVARHDRETAVASYCAAWEVLELRGPFSLGAELGAQVIALNGIAASLRALAWVTRARASWRAGRVTEAASWFGQAFAIARELDDHRLEGSVHGYLGNLNREQGRLVEARKVLETAVAMNRRTGNRRAEGMALGNLGSLHLEQGRVDEALEHHEAALAIHREIGDRRSESILLGNVGLLHRDQGRMEEARAYYDQALAIHREVKDRRSEGIVLVNLGNLHGVQGRLEDARKHFEAGLAIFREAGDRRSEGIILGNLGTLHNDQGRTEDSRSSYRQALVIHREVGNRSSEAMVLSHMGAMHSDHGRMEEARADYDCSLALYRDIGNRRDEGSVLGNLADLLVRQGRAGEAREAQVAGEALLREVGNPFELAKVLCIKGRVDVAFGDIASARAAVAEAQELAVAIGTGPDSKLGQEIAAVRDTIDSVGLPPA